MGHEGADLASASTVKIRGGCRDQGKNSLAQLIPDDIRTDTAKVPTPNVLSGKVSCINALSRISNRAANRPGQKQPSVGSLRNSSLVEGGPALRNVGTETLCSLGN